MPRYRSRVVAGDRSTTVSADAEAVAGQGAYAVVGAIGIALVSQSTALGQNRHPSTLALTVQVVIGGFLLARALFAFITRKHADGSPRWMTAVVGFGPGQAFLTGIVILSPRLKNLLLLAAALNAIGAARLGHVSGAIALVLFMAITFSPELTPLVVYLSQPQERTVAITGTWKTWLERNNHTILAIVFGVMGTKLVLDALTGPLS